MHIIELLYICFFQLTTTTARWALFLCCTRHTARRTSQCMPRAPWLTCLTESTNSITSLTLWRTRPVSALTSSTVMDSAKTNLFLLRWRKRTLYTFSLVILSFVILIFCIRHILTVNYRKICLMMTVLYSCCTYLSIIQFLRNISWSIFCSIVVLLGKSHIYWTGGSNICIFIEVP